MNNADYPYECSCGECYSNVDAAWYCKKCRVYTDEGHCTAVVDLRSGDVVRGSGPPAPPKTYTQAPWVQPTLSDLMV